LLINPLLIYDIGFQLSYLAVLGILLMYQRISNLILIRNKWLRKLWEGTAIGISAQIFTVPITLFQFHQFPNYFMISNIGIMMFAGVLLTIGILFFFFKGIGGLQSILLLALGFGISMMLFFVQFVESIPGAVATGFAPTVSTVIAMYLLILLFLFFKNKQKVLYVGVIASVVVLAFLQLDRYERMNASELIVYNTNLPLISVKLGNEIACFYRGKEGDLKKVKFLMDSYSRVKPGDVRYFKLEEGKNTIHSNKGVIEITSIGGNVYIRANKKTYFLRSKYGSAERIVNYTFDLPYLAENPDNYNLKKGAYLIKL